MDPPPVPVPAPAPTTAAASISDAAASASQRGSSTDASQYSFKELKHLQGSALFEKLDFTFCADSHLEKLFAAPPDCYLPPVPYRNSAARIMEWTSLPVENQAQIFYDLGVQPTKPFKRQPRRAAVKKLAEDATSEQLDAEDEPVRKKRKSLKKADKVCNVVKAHFIV
jgi:hypothetical protein